MQLNRASSLTCRSSGSQRRYLISVAALPGRSNGQASKVGFIGLGKMGSSMLHNLIKAGHRVVVFDNNKVAMDRALGMGELVEAATSPADVASKEGVDLLFTMLPHPATVEEVYMGKGGLLDVQGGPMASLMVDCSTVDPPLARKIAAAASRVRLNPNRHPLPGLEREESPVLIDAPVSGGVVGAEKGTLSFMVGGDVSALELVKPFLMDMGHAVTHCGGHGNGQAARLCNTLVVAATMAATSECLALARRLGVEPQVMTEVLNSSSGRSWTSEVYNPVPGICPGTPPSNQYNGGLTSNTVVEQLDMLISAGEHAHSPVPLARYLTKELYKTVQAEGMGDKDFSAIYRYYYGSGAISEQWRAGDKLFSSMPM